MSQNHAAAINALRLAGDALKRGDHVEARNQALIAARLDPSDEKPWLILAAVSSPQASVEYLRRALEINPTSKSALEGLKWAIERCRKEQLSIPQTSFSLDSQISEPTPNLPAEEQPAAPAGLDLEKPVVTKPAPQKVAIRNTERRGMLLAGLPWFVSFLLIIIVALAILGFSFNWSLWGGVPSSAFESTQMLKPSLTFTPTATHTPTPTSTPTQTPSPTPTYTPIPTETPTPIPTDTPVPTLAPEVSLPVDLSDEDRWIDVDLTNQMTYAYEGSEIVRSFVVSTGTWQHPTVTGQYRIYVKYVSTPMSGPGYYLPGVPFVMYFYKGYGLHGTYWHSNFGTPMSHGCVNLRTDDAEWLYNWASVGTLVNIHY